MLHLDVLERVYFNLAISCVMSNDLYYIHPGQIEILLEILPFKYIILIFCQKLMHKVTALLQMFHRTEGLRLEFLTIYVSVVYDGQLYPRGI